MSDPQAQPKKSSCLALGLSGCLILLILVAAGAGIAWYKFGPQIQEWVAEAQKNPEKAAALMVLKVNPDIEIINIDDEKKQATFKIKSSGETITATFADIAQGQMTYINGKTEFKNLKRIDPAAATTEPAPASPPAAPKAP